MEVVEAVETGESHRQGSRTLGSPFYGATLAKNGETLTKGVQSFLVSGGTLLACR